MENKCENCVNFIKNKIDSYDEKGQPEYLEYRHCRVWKRNVDEIGDCSNFKGKKACCKYISEIIERIIDLRQNGEDSRALFEYNLMVKILGKEFGA